MTIKAKRAALAALLGLFAAGALAQPAAPDSSRKYAVLSVVGNVLSVVAFRATTGSNLDRNAHEALPVKPDVFDHVAVRAVQAALTKLQGQVQVSLLESAAPELLNEAAQSVNSGAVTLPADVLAALKHEAATHLILITKLRGEAQLQARSTSLGSGKLEGLGYYVDRVTPVRRSDTGETGVGFLAPYVYMRVSLIDVSTMTPTKTEDVRATQTMSAARTRDSANPWDALSAAQKVDVLRRMLTIEINRTLPKLFN